MPLPPEFPAANMRWALDVISLRRFFSSDPLDTLNQTRVFTVENNVGLTDEELIALYHLGRLTPEGVREFAAERDALLRAFRHRYRHKDRPQAPPIMPLGPATTDRPRAAAAAAGAGGRPTSAGPAGSPRPRQRPQIADAEGRAETRQLALEHYVCEHLSHGSPVQARDILP